MTEPFLIGESMTGGYGRGADILHDCTIAVNPGEIAVLVGLNGAGKSTAMKAVFGMLNIHKGSVRLKGEDITDLTPQDRVAKGMAFVPQTSNIFTSLTVEENLEMGAFLRRDDIRVTMEQIFDLFPILRDKRKQAAGELSGGQRQRVGVARALANEPQLLLMDEPFGALDPITRDALGDRVRALHAEFGLTTVMVTHDMAEALLLADRVLVMDTGTVVADETPHSLLAGAGGEIAQGLVAVPRAQADRLAELAR